MTDPEITELMEIYDNLAKPYIKHINQEKQGKSECPDKEAWML